MTKIDLQYDLANYTPADSSPVEANFNRIEQHINQEIVERGGTVAMLAQLKLVGDPVADLDAAPKQYVDQVLPIGVIMMYGGAGTPPGGRWAICNGAELQTADYPGLYAVVGTAYGSTAAGRFNLPNLVNHFPMGAAPGTTGGSADMPIVNHLHSMDHVHPTVTSSGHSVNHNHGGADHLHSFTANTTGANANHWHNPHAPFSSYVAYRGTGGAGSLAAGSTLAYDATTDYMSADHAHGVSGQTSGADRGLTTTGANVDHSHQVTVPAYAGKTANPDGGVAVTNANLPPYVGVTYIIRVA